MHPVKLGKPQASPRQRKEKEAQRTLPLPLFDES